jgi:hypothetical protein
MEESGKDPEIEFLNDVLLRFLGINSSLLRLEFLSGFCPFIFRFYKMLFMNRLEISFFVDFCKAF